MGFFGDLGDFIGSTAGFVVTAGGEVLGAAVDLENMIVSLAGEVWRSVPTELDLGFLPGLLQNEFEDEILMLAGPSGIVVGLGAFPILLSPQQFDEAARTIMAFGSLVGVIKSRELNDEEWRMAEWVFNGQLPPRQSIRLTNLGNPNEPDRAITFPAIANQYYINMASRYRHKHTIKDGPLLMHELVHVWQSRNKLLRDVQVLTAAKDRDYDYTHGKQWRDYGLEQQAQIVQDWALGEIDHFHTPAKPVSPLSVGSPLFRYIFKNVRSNDNSAESVRGSSVRALAAPNQPGEELRLSKIHPGAPARWWS